MKSIRRIKIETAALLALTMLAVLFMVWYVRSHPMVRYAIQDPFTSSGGLVAVGSSTIRLWESVDKDLKPYHVISRGVSGTTIKHTEEHLDTLVLKHRPRIVVLYQGDNDLAAHMSVSDIISGFERVYARIHNADPRTVLYVVSVKISPSRMRMRDEIESLNQALQAFAQRNDRVIYVDAASALMRDGAPVPEYYAGNLHLSDAGYRVWGTTVGDAVRVRTCSILKC